MRLLLHSSAKLHQLLWHRLVRGFQHVDQRACEALLLVGEEGDGAAVLACSAGTGGVLVCAKFIYREKVGVAYRPMRCT